jgi:hypothetical protein
LDLSGSYRRKFLKLKPASHRQPLRFTRRATAGPGIIPPTPEVSDTAGAVLALKNVILGRRA